MRFRKTFVTGIVAAVVATAYGVGRWRSESDEANEQAPDTEHRAPAGE
jgi:hypothetical protein